MKNPKSPKPLPFRREDDDNGAKMDKGTEALEEASGPTSQEPTNILDLKTALKEEMDDDVVTDIESGNEKIANPTEGRAAQTGQRDSNEENWENDEHDGNNDNDERHDKDNDDPE